VEKINKIKNMKFGLLLALPIESQGLFEKNNIEVHYCGIGKVNAAHKAMELLLVHKYDGILNLGTAGSHKFPTHSLVECNAFVQRDMDLTPLGAKRGETPLDPIAGIIYSERITKLNHSGVCGTGDTFEVGPPKLECDLVDMEAYAIAKICKKMQKPFYSFKYITDGSDHSAHNDWRANLVPASQALFELYNSLHV
jgi:adenosylhomocysteine nucleosidase